MRYGASHPRVLVESAAAVGMDILGLTDRDGVYGAVRFVKAAAQAGIRPVLGVDLALERSGLLGGADPSLPHVPRRAPVRGGATVDQRHPRFTVLARGRSGWAALCRLVSATHLRGERGRPVSSLELVAEHAGDGDLVMLLGPSSEVGRALAVRRPDLAAAVLRQWRDAVPGHNLVVEVVSHRAQGESVAAARLAGFADEQGLSSVLTNAVRYATRGDAPVADVLDAARRLVALDLRHVDRTTAEGYLKSGAQMAVVAREVVAAGACERGRARALLEATRELAESCVLDPQADLGIGEVHFPELEVSAGGLGLAAAAGGSPTPSTAAADAVLRARCESGLHGRAMTLTAEVRRRLDDELDVIRHLGYPTYFLTVADVVDLIRGMGVRVAARGSGAGSLVTYALGISGVDPMRHGLLMERFLSPLRGALPDVDIDVESDRRTEIYERILERFGGDRCACVSMMDTYRARHAIRDVGAALGLPPGEIDTLAKSFPHIRARDVRNALHELPELRRSGLAGPRLDLLFSLVERLDGLPRHVALHPCGVLLSDATLLDRTPVEASWLGFPMSQFDKGDVEDLGLLKLDVLGIRMQSAMSHAVAEVARVDGQDVDLDAVPFDDPATFALVQSTHTLGCFQIESPGQRELVGKFAPETFTDLIIDISLFRPGPVKSDMVTPFLRARQGWSQPEYLHPDLEFALAETYGVVVFHEQVLHIIATLTGCTLAEADEARRAIGDAGSQPSVREWFVPAARAKGYDVPTVERAWEVLRAFASFGFCKAHAAAFALPTYQSAWLKAHHPAAFLAGVLTHDPGMYPKRLILDDARLLGISVLGLDVNASDSSYRVERLGPPEELPDVLGMPFLPAAPTVPGLPDARGYGIRLALSEVKGISEAEVARAVAGRPYGSLADFWHRAAVSRPVVERLVLAGAFDSLYGLGPGTQTRRRGSVTRRDLLLQVADLERWTRASRSPGVGRRRRAEPLGGGAGGPTGVREQAARQSQAPVAVRAEPGVQLGLDLGDAPDAPGVSGLPELTSAEQVRAQLEVLGLDASRHVIDFYVPFLDALEVTRARDLLSRRSQAEVLVAGVKVATQTPPIRSGRRVVFLTLDDATGPLDATFFEDAQGPYAATLFHTWLLVVRGFLRRTGPRGISIRATGCWELPVLHAAWERDGLPAVAELMTAPVELLSEEAVLAAAESRASRPVMVRPPVGSPPGGYEPRDPSSSTAGGMGPRRVLVHPTGFRQSPYADIKPAGEDGKSAPRKLWHSSAGSSGG